MQIKYIEAFYLDACKHEINIVTDAETIGEYCLYWTYEQDKKTASREFILTSADKHFTFSLEHDNKRRIYFIIEFSNGYSLLFGHRILPVAGMYNLRDIGGYLTESGKRIKWGKVYRSDYFALLEDAGLDYMKSLEIRTLIDLRGEQEIEERPNRVFGESVRTYICNPNAQTAAEAGTLYKNEQLNETDALVEQARVEVAKDAKAGDKKMIQQQQSFVEAEDSRRAFGTALQILAQPETSPMVLHCRGGKDRTGFALMLLEGLLGLSKEQMVYDYMLTHRARAEKNTSYYKKYLELAKDEKVAAYLFSFFDTKPEYINASIDKIVSECGSIKEYTQNVLGITDVEVSKLEALLLEDGMD